MKKKAAICIVIAFCICLYFIEIPVQVRHTIEGIKYTYGEEGGEEPVSITIDGTCRFGLRSNMVFRGSIHFSDTYRQEQDIVLISMSKFSMYGLGSNSGGSYMVTADGLMEHMIINLDNSGQIEPGETIICAPAANREEAEQYFSEVMKVQDGIAYPPYMQKLLK